MDKLTVRAIMEKHPVYVEASDFITRARQLIRDFHHRTLSGRMLMEGFEWYLATGLEPTARTGSYTLLAVKNSNC